MLNLKDWCESHEDDIKDARLLIDKMPPFAGADTPTSVGNITYPSEINIIEQSPSKSYIKIAKMSGDGTSWYEEWLDPTQWGVLENLNGEKEAPAAPVKDKFEWEGK